MRRGKSATGETSPSQLMSWVPLSSLKCCTFSFSPLGSVAFHARRVHPPIQALWRLDRQVLPRIWNHYGVHHPGHAGVFLQHCSVSLVNLLCTISEVMLYVLTSLTHCPVLLYEQLLWRNLWLVLRWFIGQWFRWCAICVCLFFGDSTTRLNTYKIHICYILMPCVHNKFTFVDPLKDIPVVLLSTRQTVSCHG